MKVLIFALITLFSADVALAENGPRRVRKERRLRHPDAVHQLKSQPGIVVRNGVRAWGTERAVRVFAQAVETVRTRFAGTVDLPVGDLSYRGGGKMRPHRSHRDGRDIDVGYYLNNGRGPRFYKATSKTIDVERTWALFKSMLQTREVEYIFLQYRLQKLLYRHALASGETKESLDELFQWPRHWSNRRGIIRHVRGHDDHFHVRFIK